jgi:hypothetical protein
MVNNSIFSQNNAMRLGGVVAIVDNNTILFKNCQFLLNSAKIKGNIIYSMINNKIDIQLSTFKLNYDS